MDEWNQLPQRSGCEKNTTRCPGIIYGETHPPSEIESVRATLLYIPKQALCGLYKKSGSGEMRFDGVIVIGYDQEW